MHFQAFIALVAAAGLVRAQFPTNLPSCATSCLVDALQDDGCSGLTNFTCHCALPNLVGDITPCIQGACDLSDQSSVSNAVTAICSSVGVTISIPPVRSATTTGSTVSTTSTGTGLPSSTTTTAATGTGTTTRSGCRTTTGVSSSTTGTGSSTSFTGSTTSSVSVSGFSNTESTSTTTSGTRSTSRTSSTSSGAPESTGGVAPISVPQLGASVAAAVGIAFMVVLY